MSKKIKFSVLIATLVCSLCVGITFTNVKAALGENYFRSEGGSIVVTPGEAAIGAPSYKGTRVVATPSATSGAKNMTIDYNGTVGKNAKLFQYMDNKVSGQLDMNAFAIIFEDSVDTNQQLAFISVNYNGSSHSTVALTDDLELESVDNGYIMKIAGTSQYSVGAPSLANATNPNYYDEFGWSLWWQGTNKNLGVLYNGDMAISFDGSLVKYNDTTPIADLKNPKFLEAGGKNLTGTKYADRYTAEYVNNLFSSGRVKLRYKLFDVKTDSAAFNIRGLNGQWLEGGTGEIADTIGYLSQKETEVYLNKTYKLSELINLHTVRPDASMASGFIGGTGEWDNGSWIDYGYFWNVDKFIFTDKSYTFATLGECKSVLMVSGPPNATSPEYHYSFNVVEGKPNITSKIQGNTLIKNQTYNLSDIFNIWNVGEIKDIKYYVNDVLLTDSNEITVIGESLKIKCQVTDDRNYEGELEVVFSAVDTNIKEKISADIEEESDYVFCVPNLPSNSNYSVKLFNENDDINTAKPLTNSTTYKFTESKNYKLVYYINVAGIKNSIIQQTNLTIKVLKKSPTITIEGNYKDIYFKNSSLNILPAEYSNGLDDVFELNILLKCADTEIKIDNQKAVLSVLGDYTLNYFIQVDENRKVSKQFNFKVIDDNVDPIITLLGEYASTYQTGARLNIIEAIINDNSGETLKATVTVLYKNKPVEIIDNILTLQNKGEYQVIYKVQDSAGNNVEKSCVFVAEGKSLNSDNKKKGCGVIDINNNNNNNLSSGILVLALGAIVLSLLKKNKEAKN